MRKNFERQQTTVASSVSLQVSSKDITPMDTPFGICSTQKLTVIFQPSQVRSSLLGDSFGPSFRMNLLHG